MSQDIIEGLRANGPGEYYIGAHVVGADNGDANIRIRVRPKDSTSSSLTTETLPQESITGSFFCRVCGVRNLGWAGQLEPACLEITGSVGGTCVDDASAEFLA